MGSADVAAGEAATATRARAGRPPRPAWWPELLLVAATYGIYTLTRNTLPAHVARARADALALYRAERRLHVDVERTLNDAVAAPAAHAVAVVANYTYSLAHFGVTVSVLVWLYLAHPRAYPRARTVLLVATLLGLLGFWLYPLAPPRFFPGLGFVDTVVRDHTWGSWGSSGMAAMSNQYAAMPSVHIAWSTWSAAMVLMFARRRWVKALACLYPPLVFVVILGTANHWTLDAVGGLAAVALSLALCLGWRAVRRTMAGRAVTGRCGC